LQVEGFFHILNVMRKDFQAMLDSIKQQEDTPAVQTNENFHSRVLIIDALNLFFRNFATINMINKDGAHIGGLAGSIRSLGSLIQLCNPTGVYVIFDGVGSSTNRKNLLPEYKSNRGINRITNWDTFDDLEEENDAKVGQITRFIHYLQCLPIKVGMIDKAEADDMIAYMAAELPKQFNSEVVIVSSDKDYLQLVSDKVTLYRPVTKVFYGPKDVKREFLIHPDNFIIYKTMLGDQSDKIEGVKGLGPKTLLKLFPDIMTVPMSLNDIFQHCEDHLSEHKVYPQILFRKNNLENHYKLMNLKNPILDDRQINYIEDLIQSENNGFYKKQFLELYDDDQIGFFIKDIDQWVTESFFKLARLK
jgi:DNA polymerase I